MRGIAEQTMTQIHTCLCYEFCFPCCTVSNLSCFKTYSQWLKNIVENIPITFSFIICRQIATRKSSNYCKFWTSIAFKTKIWKTIYFLHILPNSCLFTVRTSKNFKSKQERKNLVCAILSSEKSLGKAKHPSNHHRWNGSASKN